ncbi:type I restriction enzyme S subunit [Acinetobacter sp. BIGb0102]|nr:type I restriction enzyme S subunit [Acinetobacter sp. BIGb0102]
MKLGECAEIHSGSTPRTNNPDFWDGDITWVTPKDLSKLKSKFISKTESKITQLGFNSCSTKLLPKNSVLFSSRAPIGHVAINTIPMCTNQGFKSFVPKADLLDSQYLYYWLKANKEYLQDLGVGATFKEISKTVIANVEIPLPPLAEQRRIASILDQADVLRQKRQQTIEKLDQLLQATFIDMFGDPVSNPKGWDKEKMDTLMTIVRGGSPRPIENFLGGTYPWIKIGDATKGDDLFITKTKEAITEEGLHKTRLLPEGSVIFANCGVSLGFARILKIQGCIHDGWLAFQDIREDKIHKLFLLKALNSITQYFRDTAPDGTQPNLNTAIMKNFELIIPPMDLQLKFIAIVESIVKQKKILETSNIEFSNLFKSLQNQAFNGTL